MQKVSLVDKT